MSLPTSREEADFNDGGRSTVVSGGGEKKKGPFPLTVGKKKENAYSPGLALAQH